MIWTDLAFGPRYMGLNLHVIGLEFGLQFKKKKKWLGRRLGTNLVGLNRAWQGGSGPLIKKLVY